MTVTDPISPACASPAPAAPAIAARTGPTAPTRSGSPLGEDRIERPTARPSPEPHSIKLPGPADGLPLLIAGGIVLGGAAIMAAPVAAEGGAIAEGAAALGGALVRSRTFLAAAGREFSAEYRAAAAKVADTKLTDPKELGKALGAQTWTATEELGRSTIVGAGLAGGASLVQHASGAVGQFIDRERMHAAKR